jgi:hypothetical protein
MGNKIGHLGHLENLEYPIVGTMTIGMQSPTDGFDGACQFSMSFASYEAVQKFEAEIFQSPMYYSFVVSSEAAE